MQIFSFLVLYARLSARCWTFAIRESMISFDEVTSLVGDLANPRASSSSHLWCVTATSRLQMAS